MAPKLALIFSVVFAVAAFVAINSWGLSRNMSRLRRSQRRQRSTGLTFGKCTKGLRARCRNELFTAHKGTTQRVAAANRKAGII